MQQDSEAINLEQALRILRRRAALVVLCVAIVAGAAYAYSRHQEKKYTAAASLAFDTNQLSRQVVGLPVTTGDVPAQQASNLELVKRGDMAERTAAALGHGLTAERVASSLSVAPQGESSVVVVSATERSAPLAAAIANTYVDQFVAEQRSANRRYFRSALALVNKQLDRLTPQQRVGVDGVALQNRAQTLGLLSELDYGSVQVVQSALAPTSPSSPRTSRSALLGGFLGLLIGVGLAFVLERLDRRVRSPEDLEAIYQLPMLGVVPKSSALAGFARRAANGNPTLDPVDAEAFSLIRAHLDFFNVDERLRSIVIASASQGDGKTTVAIHLAEAAAAVGSRVLLIEADLRNPTLAGQLSIEAGPGLCEVLVDALRLDEATQSIDLGVEHGEDGTRRGLDVLVAGPTTPPNPAGLIQSRAMEALLDWAKSAYDLVVIDTPPLTSVSDAFPLLTSVDGVIVVSWVGRSRRDPAERLRRVLKTSRARTLGVIANGATSGVPSGYPARSAPSRAASASGSIVSASQEIRPPAVKA